MLRICLITLSLIWAAVLTASAQREPVDKIAVVVGDQVILASELASQVQMTAFQSGQRPTTEQEVKELQDRVLDRMISDKLFLLEAKTDTSISIRPEEVEQALEEQIARVSGNFDSEAQFIQALEQEGLTLRDLKKRYRKELENQLLRQRFIQKKLYSVSVSRHEVENFYQTFKDSIPEQPEAIKLAHILLAINPSQEAEDSVRAAAAELRQRVLDGADFATLATQNSSGEFGANGGDLGYLSPSDVVPEFSRAAFQLQPGDISGVVRTQFGYHVIKCEGKRGETSRLRHILLEVMPTAEDSIRVKSLADSLLALIRSGSDFMELAKTFSSDDDSRGKGGELGWFAKDQMFPEFVDAVSGWQTPGETRGPVGTRFGLHLLKLLDFQPSKTITLEGDYDRIKEMARQDKTGRMVDEWIADIKKKTFVDYRLES